MGTWLSGQVGEVTAAGWAKVENQDDMADFALVRASPTDWPVADDKTMSCWQTVDNRILQTDSLKQILKT